MMAIHKGDLSVSTKVEQSNLQLKTTVTHLLKSFWEKKYLEGKFKSSEEFESMQYQMLSLIEISLI